MHEPEGAVLPSAEQAEAWLAELGVAEDDRLAVLAARPELEAAQDLMAVLEERRRDLLTHLGDPRPLPAWPDIGPPHERVGNLLYVWVFLSALPAVRAFHERHGVTRRDGSRVLANLAAQVAAHRSLHGAAGLSGQNWLTRHFRATIFDFGRLHVERTYFEGDVPGGGATSPVRGEPVLALHIPEGRLTAAACDESIAAATTFFRREFGHEDYRFGVCTSWVLDPQLRSYLADDSNILTFQRRFELAPGTGPDCADTVIEFVFKRPATWLDALAQDTSLQRALVTHVRAGRPWHFRTGWFPL
ncbi:acyltransferase domain-containing protein [Jiangella muralis]|uniref:acyltransferase domain-containing protein n=1 Tax=Jiangella muralis TaxID=702383 RepID=UPI00069DE248|nr:acyltransferase domain-containing protein [Jiangella muralis]